MAIAISETPIDRERTRFIERPDGMYWQFEDGGGEFGPFATLAAAVADMEAFGEAIGVGESLEEAESEIGIADWIDPDTGQLAEDHVPRLEDH
jgi:hypothetical protein